MKAVKGLVILSICIIGLGLILLAVWENYYNYRFGICQVTGYSIGPGMYCQWTKNSPLCSTSFCSMIQIDWYPYFNLDQPPEETSNFSPTNNQSSVTSFIPMAFDGNFFNCWSTYSYSELKELLLKNYPLGSNYTCYSNINDNSIRLSSSYFSQVSYGLFLAGILIFTIGVIFVVMIACYVIYSKYKSKDYFIL